MESFMSTYNVSRETFAILSRYVNILDDWQAKMNLVSPKSMAEVWTRHIADSLQLYQHLNSDTKTVYDIGSGAGFPAIVLAIQSMVEQRDIKFKLIESITKKTVYLNAVKNELNLKNVEIINTRSENLKLAPADVITARAVAALDKLFALALPLVDKHTVLLLLKGKTYQAEIDEALKHWSFYVKVLPNNIEPEGVILQIANLRKK
ncbi:MAG TPA: 16S rRNA (guanine(527)-N(7))-methyltransferase RsmG [Alphaproteobacteria bacterium]|nr:16S rRNA (guanine(527)-N(7))-methyltransferase RsmG [Alphaproteobacteria bacterium]